MFLQVTERPSESAARWWLRAASDEVRIRRRQGLVGQLEHNDLPLATIPAMPHPRPVLLRMVVLGPPTSPAAPASGPPRQSAGRAMTNARRARGHVGRRPLSRRGRPPSTQASKRRETCRPELQRPPAPDRSAKGTMCRCPALNAPGILTSSQPSPHITGGPCRTAKGRAERNIR